MNIFQGTLEAVVVKGLDTLCGKLRALEVHESIAHVGHGALVQWAVEEIKGTFEAQILQLLVQLPLGVAIWDVADPQRTEMDRAQQLCIKTSLEYIAVNLRNLNAFEYLMMTA